MSNAYPKNTKQELQQYLSTIKIIQSMLIETDEKSIALMSDAETLSSDITLQLKNKNILVNKLCEISDRIQSLNSRYRALSSSKMY